MFYISRLLFQHNFSRLSLLCLCSRLFCFRRLLGFSVLRKLAGRVLCPCIGGSFTRLTGHYAGETDRCRTSDTTQYCSIRQEHTTTQPNLQT